MKKTPSRALMRKTSPSENDFEPTVEIPQLALVDAKQDGAGYDPYNTRALTPASRVRPKMDVWQSKSKRG